MRSPFAGGEKVARYGLPLLTVEFDMILFIAVLVTKMSITVMAELPVFEILSQRSPVLFQWSDVVESPTLIDRTS